MDTRNNNSEDRPLDTNPDEVNKSHPASQIKAQEKIAINQSGLGREQGQTPADEHIESHFSQIDDGTTKIQEGESGENKSGASIDNTGYMNDSTSADRDTGNNSGGWEESRTARHK